MVDMLVVTGFAPMGRPYESKIRDCTYDQLPRVSHNSAYHHHLDMELPLNLLFVSVKDQV